VHKTFNVVDKLPTKLKPEVKERLHDIWQADSKKETRSQSYPMIGNCRTLVPIHSISSNPLIPIRSPMRRAGSQKVSDTDDNTGAGVFAPVVVKRRKALGGLLVRREGWGLSLCGAILAIAIALAAAAVCLRGLYPFLALTDRVPSDVLVVDGWMPTQVLKQAAEEYTRGNYHTVLVVRGVYALDPIELEQSWDDYVVNILVRRGIPRERLNSVLFSSYKKDRTYHSALAIKEWCHKNGLAPAAFNIATVGSHARRSRMLYERVFGKDVRIGVVGLGDPAFDAQHWWRSSEGVREVLFEGVAYLYVLLNFFPDP
jgi:hypothetical protein